MKSFLDFCQQLDEKQIQYGKNANYGQVVFFAGGAASGKGFAISNFIDSSKFKIRDVDKLKEMLLRTPSMLKKYPEMKSFSLSVPEHVAALHAIAKKENIPDKQLQGWISSMKYPETLPNILFDVTLKDFDDLHKYVPALIAVGYKPENVHITWVLTNFSVAVLRNKQRARVVPEDIVLLTHSGAAFTMAKVLTGSLPAYVNGSITVILNNDNEVKFYDRSAPGDTGLTTVKTNVVRDFTYLTIKQPGRALAPFVEIDTKVRETLLRWVVDNVPDMNTIHKAWLK